MNMRRRRRRKRRRRMRRCTGRSGRAGGPGTRRGTSTGPPGRTVSTRYTKAGQQKYIL